MTQTEFEILAADRGHGDLRRVEFAADRSPELHPHPWSTLLLVIAGDLTLAFEDRVLRLEPGDWCEVAAGELHSERTGPHGAVAVLATLGRPVDA
jgi:quercetin dioxygenase-like cupin family protein